MPSSPPPAAFWQLPLPALLRQLDTQPDGLDSASAAARLAQYGPNLIHGERKSALALEFLGKFRNPLIDRYFPPGW